MGIGLDPVNDLQGERVDRIDEAPVLEEAQIDLRPVRAHGEIGIVEGPFRQVVDGVRDLVGRCVDGRELAGRVGHRIQHGAVGAQLDVADSCPGISGLDRLPCFQGRCIHHLYDAALQAGHEQSGSVGRHRDAAGGLANRNGPGQLMGGGVDGIEHALPGGHRIEDRPVGARRHRGRIDRDGCGHGVRGCIDDRYALLLGGDVNPVSVGAHVDAVGSVPCPDAGGYGVRAGVDDRHVAASAVGDVGADPSLRLGMVHLHGHGSPWPFPPGPWRQWCTSWSRPGSPR